MSALHPGYSPEQGVALDDRIERAEKDARDAYRTIAELNADLARARAENERLRKVLSEIARYERNSAPGHAARAALATTTDAGKDG